MINFDEYVSWPALCQDINEKTSQNYFFGRCNPNHNGLSRNEKLPYSISEYEFNFLKDFIIKNNLKNGFELATGTCISTLAIGYAFSKTGGKLVSIDSYEEEVTQNQPNQSTGRVFDESHDYTLNLQLVNSYNLNDTIKLFAGWSPRDCERFLDENFKNDVDFVFFDCPKCSEDFIRDTSFLKTRINLKKFAIFVHDTHCFMEEFNRLGYEIFGVRPTQLTDFYSPKGNVKQVFPLSVITNIG